MNDQQAARIGAIGTYVPPWVSGRSRVAGPDEDALTMAVAAGRAADPAGTAERVVFVSRDFPLLEGGNSAVLLAGLSLEADVPVVEVLGGAPAVLDQLIAATPGTLVVAADGDGAVGAAAALLGSQGAELALVGRVSRSLPLAARGADGVRHLYGDPRLQRDVGTKGAVSGLDLRGKVCAAVGLSAKDLGPDLDASAAVIDGSDSGPSVLRALAESAERGGTGLVIAAEQASVSVGQCGAGSVTVVRDEAAPQELPTMRRTQGNGIPISLAAYSRAFDPKLRWEAAVFGERPGIGPDPVFPPRARVDDNGVLSSEYDLVPLPRTGTVYTHTTIRIPVPDLPSPYTLAIVQLDGSPVRVLLKVTGVPAGSTEVGQTGAVVMRKVADRAGVPDYGYAFWPGRELKGVSA